MAKGEGKSKGKGKMVLATIQNPANRRGTFDKGKMGVLKKAHKLSSLSARIKLYRFGNPKMKKIMRGYTHFCASDQHFNNIQSIKVLQLELENLRKVMDDLEKTYKYMTGEEIDTLSLRELRHYEKKLEKGSRRIHSRKEKLLEQKMKSLNKEMCRDKNVVDAGIHLKATLCDDQFYEDKDEGAQDHDPTQLIGFEAKSRSESLMDYQRLWKLARHK